MVNIDVSIKDTDDLFNIGNIDKDKAKTIMMQFEKEALVDYILSKKSELPEEETTQEDSILDNIRE
jgi:hypothetical protein